MTMVEARFVGAPLRRVRTDGVYLQARMGPQAEYMLVLMDATPEGKKELIGFRPACGKASSSCRDACAVPY